MPLAAVTALLYYEFVVPADRVAETNSAMRQRMCREHVDLAGADLSHQLARVAIEECISAGDLTEAQGVKAFD